MEVYGAREDPVPGVTGALVADAVPLPAGRVALRAVLVGRRAGAGRPRPARRPGGDHGRRRRVDGRARRCCRRCAAPGGTASEPHRHDRAGDRTRDAAGDRRAAAPPAGRGGHRRSGRCAAPAGSPATRCSVRRRLGRAAAGRRRAGGCCGRARCSPSATVQVDGVRRGAVRRRGARTPPGSRTGTPLLRVDVDAAAARVRRLPQVASAEVTRGWPDRVVVTVAERVPVAVVHATAAAGSWSTPAACCSTPSPATRRPASSRWTSPTPARATRRPAPALAALAALPARRARRRSPGSARRPPGDGHPAADRRPDACCGGAAAQTRGARRRSSARCWTRSTPARCDPAEHHRRQHPGPRSSLRRWRPARGPPHARQCDR